MSTSLLVTVIPMVLIVALGIGLWARSRRARPIVGAAGVALLLVGLLLLGVTDLTINGVKSIVRWVQRTQWDTTMTVGASLAGVGLLLAIIALLLPKDSKAPSTSQPDRKRRPVAGQTRPGITPTSTSGVAGTRQSGTTSKTGKDGLTDEDREIQELLKQRGIM